MALNNEASNAEKRIVMFSDLASPFDADQLDMIKTGLASLGIVLQVVYVEMFNHPLTAPLVVCTCLMKMTTMKIPAPQ